VNSHCESWSPKWTHESSKHNFRDQNQLVQKILYIIEKLLKCKFQKCAFMTHLDIWNTSYGQKKGRESNWQFDFRPLKVRNRPDFLAFRWRETHRWKALDKGYNFSLDFIGIGGIHAKLWAPKVARVLAARISRLPLGSPDTKCHLDVVHVRRCIIYYKGEGGGFPQVWVVVNLVSLNLPMARPSTKSAQTMH
jgi:hypothetical protein